MRQEEAFNKLKERVTSEPVLAHPELDKQFEVEVDASGFALGAVLLQKKDDSKKHPIAYYSSTLNAAERNYDIYELEYLAIHRAMMHWRHFLVSRRPARPLYPRLTHKQRASYGHAQGLSDWRLVI